MAANRGQSSPPFAHGKTWWLIAACSRRGAPWAVALLVPARRDPPPPNPPFASPFRERRQRDPAGVEISDSQL
jgi:hypothetical protein